MLAAFQNKYYHGRDTNQSNKPQTAKVRREGLSLGMAVRVSSLIFVRLRAHVMGVFLQYH